MGDCPAPQSGRCVRGYCLEENRPLAGAQQPRRKVFRVGDYQHRRADERNQPPSLIEKIGLQGQDAQVTYKSCFKAYGLPRGSAMTQNYGDRTRVTFGNQFAVFNTGIAHKIITSGNRAHSNRNFNSSAGGDEPQHLAASLGSYCCGFISNKIWGEWR